ncbi:hypothetical protein [Pseudolabrys sp. FHR47]|uniref:hypothetical protein n=1 Tax=Pseudolabrys sp. FHR47 TaxID=2562284 RepID=UPI0019801352|nr:hypothetical protein [Pseudolabrys sp. FHR47]
MAKFNMRTVATALTAATLVAIMIPASANAAGRYHERISAQDARYVRAAYAAEPRYEARRARVAERNYRYAPEPVYAASPFPSEPLLYPIGGAVIGAIIGAAVCPPCSIAGSALTSGGGALVGAGIGAVGGTLVGVAVTQPQERYVRF